MGSSAPSQIPSSIDTVASNANADLINKQWQDYQNRFQPQENNLISQMGTGLQTTFLPQSLKNAQTGVNNAYASAAGQQSRDLSRFGQGMNALQSQALATNTGISNAASNANANNSTVQADQDLKNAVMSGGLGAAATVGQK